MTTRGEESYNETAIHAAESANIRNMVGNKRAQHPKQQGVNGRLASGEAFRAALGEILASRKNLVKIRGNACLD